MTDSLPTTWQARAHTLAKHKILEAYLKAWIPILSRQASRSPGSRELLYVDGFAGPGIYEDGEPGSPILAIDTLLEFENELPTPIRLVFIEIDDERHRVLCEEVGRRKEQLNGTPSINVPEPIRGDCTTELTRMLDHSTSAGPALYFLDQFGYSEVPLTLIARIMGTPQCEVFTYLNWGHLNRFLTDETKWPSITQAFGSDDWKLALEKLGHDRQVFLRELYKGSLKRRGNSRYVLEFAMSDESRSLLHWLFFCTNNLKGLYEMKRAMWKVDESGSFQFSDAHNPNQQVLLEGCTDDWLANELSHRLTGATISIGEMEEFVLTETPAYQFKKALAILERSERITILSCPPGRRKCTFPDKSTIVRFL